jgi:sphingosine kinase
VRPADLHYNIDSNRDLSLIWIAKLLDRAYGESQKQKRAKILVNPHAGKGSAQKWYTRDIEPILRAARIHIDVQHTRHQGEAVSIAAQLDIDAFDMVVSCSGDGLPHEVFNGLGRRADARRALAKIAVVQMPCGSGNAMSCNLTGSASASLAALATVKGVVTPLDLISITQGSTRTLSFLSQSVGIVAESDLATEHIRWMGQARFTYGFLTRLLRKRVYPCDIAVKVGIDDKAAIREHYQREIQRHEPPSERRGPRSDIEDDASASSSGGGASEEGLPPLRYGTINDKLPADWEMVRHDTIGNFYCGNVSFSPTAGVLQLLTSPQMCYMAADANFFAPALPADGFMDLVCIDGRIGRAAAIDLMLAVESNKFFDKPLVSYRKVLGYRIVPREQKDGYISIDGERVPFEPFQAEIHRGLGTVLARRGGRFEAPGP